MDYIPTIAPRYDREFYKRELREVSLTQLTNTLNGYKINIAEILWAAKDLAKEGDVEKAMQIAEFYFGFEDKNTKNIEELNDLIKKGEDTRVIATVLGTLPWLLQGIIVQCINSNLDGSYYTRALDIIEQLARNSNLYARQQVGVALEILAANLKATKHKEGDKYVDFKFSQLDKDRAENIAFKMLEENKEWDRILEYLVTVFNRMRYLDEERALYVLKTFFYKNGELRPDYITDNVAALAMYYAEFRASSYDKGFEDIKFKEFLKNIISNSRERVRSRVLWIFWKNYRKEDMDKIKPYLPLFLDTDYSDEVRAQWDFLVEKVSEDDIDSAFDLLKQGLEYVKKGLEDNKKIERPFLYVDKTIQRLYEYDRERVEEILDIIIFLKSRSVDMGNIEFLFNK